MAKIIAGSKGSKASTDKVNQVKNANAKSKNGKELVLAKDAEVEGQPGEELVKDGAVQASGGDRIVLAQADTGASGSVAGGAAAPAEAGSAAGAEAGAVGSGTGASSGAAAGGAAAMSGGMMALVGVGLAAVAVGVAAGSNSDSTPAAAPAATADTTAPLLQSVAVSPEGNNKIVLTYNEALDAANPPGAGTFAVTANAVPNAVTAVAVSGSAVTLTLTTPLAAGDVVSVTYTDPTVGNDVNAIQDAVGNDAVTATGGFTLAVASDGYVRGAKIYIDTDNDGLADTNEDTGVVTNADGGFILPAGAATGTIIAVGGVNIDTGVPNTVALKAPAGSTVVTPLTTLVQAYIEENSTITVAVTAAEASAAVVEGLGLLVGTDLTTYDPLAVLAADGSDATALAVQQAAVQVATLVALAAESADTDANTATTVAAAIDTVFSNLVTAIDTAVDASSTIDLTDAPTITAAITGAVDDANLATVTTDVDTATTAIDGAVTLAGITIAQAVALDDINPAAPTAIGLAAVSDTGTTGDNTTNDTTPTIRVSFNAIATDGTAAVAGDTVTVLEGATTVGTAILTPTNIADRYVDVTLSAPLSGESAHTLTAALTDIATNASAVSGSLAITLDTIAPAAPTVALATDSGAADTISNVGTLNVTGIESGATVQYSTDGGTSWSGSFTAAEGANSVQVRQSDVAGNASIASTLAFTLDTTIATPAIALTTNSGSTSDTITNSAGLTISGAAGDITRSFSVNGGAGSGSYTAPTTDGTYTVTVTDTDTAGNTASASTTFTLDTAAPTLSSTTPADNAINVVGNSIVLTFAEAVAIGAGNIVLSDGTTSTNISVTDGSQVAISGNTVTITPAVSPSPNTSYSVTLASGVIIDVAGNAFAGIGSGALDFTMANNPSVTIATDDNTLNIGDTAALTFTLSAASTNFTAADVTVTGGTLSNFSGSGTTYTATFTPTANSTTAATVNVAANTFTDGSSLNNLAASQVSMTVDTVAPTLSSSTPADGATNVAGGAIVLTFSEAVAAGTGDIIISDGTTPYTIDVTDASQVVFSGNMVTVTSAVVPDPSTPYYVQIESGAIADAAGNAYAGITNSTTLNFTTAAAPTLTSSALDGVTNLDVRSELVLTFSESIALGSGQIRIMDDMGTSGWTLTNTTTVESKQDVTDNDVVITLVDGSVTGLTIGGVDKAAEMAGSVSVSGDKLIITPAGSDNASTTDWDFDWDFGASYHVELGAGVVESSATGIGNPAITDSTTLNFTTVTPLGNATGAASQTMTADGALTAGYIWHHGHVADATADGYAMNFTTDSHALVLQSATGADTRTTTIGGKVLLSGLGIDDIIYMDNSGDVSIPTTDGLKGANYTGSGDANARLLDNADGGTQLQTVFADYSSTGFTAITALGGGDLMLENATHYNANIVVFG